MSGFADKGDVEAAIERWREAGPLDSESLKLLIDWREASLSEQPTELIFAAFVRSLTPEQQRALTGVMELVDGEDAFRWF